MDSVTANGSIWIVSASPLCLVGLPSGIVLIAGSS